MMYKLKESTLYLKSGKNNTIYSLCIMCVQYIGGCSVHRGDAMSTGGYHEYIGGVQYIEGYHDTSGGYHEYIGGCSVH